MTQNKKIAVTGGLGSGKTAFCGILRAKGYPVFSCDEISDGLWRDSEYLAGLAERFPACVSDGIPQKRRLSDLVFSDDDARKKLNEYAHPRIMEILFFRMKEFPIAFAEVPLLFEGGYETQFDAVIALIRSRESRIRSVAERLTPAEAAQRIAVQIDQSRIADARCLRVENNGSLEDLARAAEEILHRLGLA